MKTTIKSIATGIAKDYDIKDKIFFSAYKKDKFMEFCFASTLGLEGDFQIDKRFHGGVDKAIHIGASKHFDIFKKLYNQELDKLAIGCNIFIDNYDENDICIGDIYTIGEVKIEVTQPRQPCWKIGAIFGKETSRYIAKQNATGWYVRVLNEGILNVNNPMILEKRVSTITIKQLSQYLTTPPKENKELIDNILNTPSLAQSYRDDFNHLLTNG